MVTRQRIGEGGDQQRARMGRHVEAVSDERHRAEKATTDDLAHHHGGGEADHHPGLALVLRVLGAEEDVAMLPALERLLMHDPALLSLRGIS